MSEEIVIPSVEQIKAKFVEQLRESGWYAPMRMFINSGEFTKIIEGLLSDFTLQFRIVPRLIDIFRAFVVSPLNKTKVVIYTSEFPEYLNAYDGIAFSRSRKKQANHTLQYMFDEISPTYKGKIDLTRWTEQGILMIPSALTTLVGKKDAHIELWKSWNNSLFDVFKHDLPKDTIYVFIGEEVYDRANSLDEGAIILKYPHPTCNFPERWGVNPFEDINNLLKQQGKEAIKW